MKGAEQSFTWLKEKIFEVPFFQRPYVWGKEEWDDLWNSIIDSNGSDMPFIGSFIIQEKTVNDEKIYTIIDGQQRLTTLSILIKAFLDAENLSSNKSVTVRQFNNIEDMIVIVDSQDESIKTPRITPSSVDRVSYDSVLKTVVDIKTIDETSPKILQAYKHFFECLLVDENRIFLSKKLLSTKEFYIAIMLDEKDDDQKIFDSVNSTGMDLKCSDIIKNNLYQKLKELNKAKGKSEKEVIKLYKANWEDVFQIAPYRAFWDTCIIVGRNDRNQLDLFFKDYATIKGIYIASQTGGIDNLSKSFKDHIKNMDYDSLVDLIKEIGEYAKTYYGLFNKDIEKECFKSYSILDLLLLEFKVTNTATFNPYLLKLEHDNPGDKKEQYAALQKFFFGRMIYEGTTKNYNKVCESVLKSNSPIDYLETYKEDTAIDYSLFPSGLLKIGNNNAKLVLLVCELIRRESLGSTMFPTLTSYSSIQLEHVLPQKWHKNWLNVDCYNSDGTKITDDFIIEEIRKQKIYSIGNMTLLSAKLNNTISNSSFAIKVKGDGKKPGIETFVGGLLVAKEIVDSYNNNPNWDETNIFARDKEIFTTLNDFYGFTNGSTVQISPISITNTPVANVVIDPLDKNTWVGSHRKVAFVLIKYLLENGKLNDSEVDELLTSKGTKNIIKDIRNSLLIEDADCKDWKVSRYSKETVQYKNKALHINNQWTADTLDVLITWYSNKI